MKRQEQKRQTHQKIRETAKALFSSQGFEATTSRQIAKEAGVATGTLFVHFESKNAILADILFEDIEATVQQAFLDLPAERSTADKLIHLANRLYAYYIKQRGLSRTLLQYSVFEQNSQGDFSNQIQAFIEAITGLIEQGQANGDVVTGKEAESMATAFMAAYFFVLMNLLRDENFTLESAIGQLEKLAQTILK
ncbi:MAG: TetR/AcrR family transcriptional regulator [Anaerolineae bacterium]